MHLAYRVTLKHLLEPNILLSVTFFAHIMALKYMGACGVFALQHRFFPWIRKHLLLSIAFLLVCLAPQSLLCGYGEKLDQIPTLSLLLVQCANLCLFTRGSESMFVSDAAVCV